MMWLIKKLFFLVQVVAVFVFLLLAALWIWNLFVDELPEDELEFGVTFSKIYAEELGLDWREAYLATLDELGVRRIRIPIYWSEVEPENDAFTFEDTDFLVEEAAKRNAEIILAVGQKLPRWPECHIPEWVTDENRKNELLEYIGRAVSRYQYIPNIKYWQVENEPFLAGFGVCPKKDTDLLDKEIALVKSLDERPVLITDSGELGDWVRARRRGDIFGTTMYRDVWFRRTFRFRYPLPPTWFVFKDAVSKAIAGENAAEKTIVVEMQAEAWGKDPIPFLTLEEQLKYMSFEDFKENIAYARRAQIPEIYLWGAEWWYALKVNEGRPEFWEYAKELF